jgi:hypothetical protein
MESLYQMSNPLKKEISMLLGNWQSIETAKKDGKRILIYQEGMMIEIEGGRWDSRQWVGDTGWPKAPTHWKPLPLPPCRKKA